MRDKIAWIFLCFSISMGSSACVPSNMHVSYGLNPSQVDDDVRFRATYYFRTFDYCWDANPKTPFSELNLSERAIRYRDIIPQTDTLYRYKMTGKASALFSRIRFESGILRREQIDPFGTQVSFSQAADGFVIRDQAEIKESAKKDFERRDILIRIDDMLKRYRAMPDGADKTAMFVKINDAVEMYLENSSDRTEGDVAIKELNDKIAATGADTADRLEKIESLLEVNKLRLAEDKTQIGPCPIGNNIRKGFQVMGPEGLKTFDQDERLVMAMSSSAKPLIETLQEYSGRILNSRADTSGQLIALARENAQVEAERRMIADARRVNGFSIEKLTEIRGRLEVTK